MRDADDRTSLLKCAPIASGSIAEAFRRVGPLPPSPDDQTQSSTSSIFSRVGAHSVGAMLLSVCHRAQ